MFDYIAKEHYGTLVKDIDGNDPVDFLGIFNGTNIAAANTFYNEVYKMYLTASENLEGGAAAGGVPKFPKEAFVSDDEDLDD